MISEFEKQEKRKRKERSKLYKRCNVNFRIDNPDHMKLYEEVRKCDNFSQLVRTFLNIAIHFKTDDDKISIENFNNIILKKLLEL